MTNSNSVLFFVADVSASVRFYTNLMGLTPVEDSPTFALFILPSGLAIGLWDKLGVEPKPTVSGVGCELGFKVDRAEEVDLLFAKWHAQGAEIAMPPTQLDFGRSFVALDPDGHRLRVYEAADAP